ncbi:MAG TPA: 3-isopropylmalate dehydrogenase [Bryobacteraceae bacterium]|jgi:3-isopropylmalate dehydrogenase|nr:3-isopropylmalate dehydrogenase [Bryobacteraceae bacterium]
MSKFFNVLLLPGDGIGVEVTAAARKVLEAAAAKEAVDLKFETRLVGGACYDDCGEFLTDETLQLARDSDAVLFGSEGGPKWDSLDLNWPPERRSGLTRLRRQLQLFANLRPIRPLDCLIERSTLKSDVIRGVDFIILRELCGGIYFGEPRGIGRGPDGEMRGFETQIYTESEIVRVSRVAFNLARQRRKKVTSVEKSNVMESGFFWRQVITRVGREEFPDVELEHMYADNAAMQIVRQPKQFDVLVTDNLFGDLLSDCAAMITGSLGMLPSASLAAPELNGKQLGLYEPIHGSAPDIAGKGIANPIGSILSAGMLARHSLKNSKIAQSIEKAVESVLASGIRPSDLGGTASTADMTENVLQRL